MTVTLWKISSPSFAAKYYGEENYSQNNPKQFERSQWHGQGAKMLGLSGKVDADTLTRIMKGETLDGRCIGQLSNQTLKRALQMKHIPGTDITFAPPKDISLLYYIGKDKRIIEAHSSAANKSLDWIEKNISAPFPRSGEQIRWDKNRKLVIATFNHDISRDKDPHLHTHSLVANMVYSDNKWNALKAYYIYLTKAIIEFIYDSYLKQAVRDLGYQITPNPKKHQSWYVAGTDQQAINLFSNRKFEITETLNKNEFYSHKVRTRIVTESRQPKSLTTTGEMQSYWVNKCGDWAGQLENLCALAKLRTEKQLKDYPILDKVSEPDQHEASQASRARTHFKSTPNAESVDEDAYSLNRLCSEREYAARAAVSFAVRSKELQGETFSILAILKTACRVAPDGITIEDVEKQVHELVQENKHTFTYDKSYNTLRTPNMVPEKEKFRPFVERAGQDLLPAYLKRRGFPYVNYDLTPQQERAIQTILSSKNLIVGIEGYPGSGDIADSVRSSQLPKNIIEALYDRHRPIIGVMTCRSIDTELKKTPNFQQFETPKFKSYVNSYQAKSITSPVILIDVTNIMNSNLLVSTLNDSQKLDPARIVLFDNLNLSKMQKNNKHTFRLVKDAGLETAQINDVDRIKQICDQTNVSIASLRSNMIRIGAAIDGYTSTQECTREIIDEFRLSQDLRTKDRVTQRPQTLEDKRNFKSSEQNVTRETLPNKANSKLASTAAIKSNNWSPKLRNQDMSNAKDFTSVTPALEYISPSDLLDDFRFGRCRVIIPDDELRRTFNQKIRQELIESGDIGSSVILINRDGSVPSVAETKFLQNKQQDSSENFTSDSTSNSKTAIEPETTTERTTIDSSLSALNSYSRAEATSFASIFKISTNKGQSAGTVNQDNSLNDKESTKKSSEEPTLQSEPPTNSANTMSSESVVRSLEQQSSEIGNDMSISDKEGNLQKPSGQFPETTVTHSPPEEMNSSESLLNSQTDLDPLELRLFENLQLTSTQTGDDSNPNPSFTEAMLVGYDENSLTLLVGDSHQVVQQDDPVLRTAEYAYAKPEIVSNVSNIEEVVLVMNCDDDMTPERFRMLIDLSSLEARISIRTDDCERLASKLENHTSLPVELPNIDRGWTLNNQQEEVRNNTAPQNSVNMDLTSNSPSVESFEISSARLESSSYRPIDLEMELSR